MIWVIETVMTTNGICLFIGNAKLRMTGRSSCDSNSDLLGREADMVKYSAVVSSIFLVWHAKKNLLICHYRLAECLVLVIIKQVNLDVQLS